MGKNWDVDDILERALQEEDPQGMDEVVARLVAEEKMSRSSLLRRSAAAGVGLTILSSPATAFARSSGAAAAAPPLRGASIPFATILKNAKGEKKINTIALPPDWANYGEIMSTFKKKYGLQLTNDNPDGSSAQENEAVRSLKGDSRAPDVLDVGPSFAILGANEGLYAKYYNRYWGSVPRAMKDGRGFWLADYWGVTSFGVNQAAVSNVPKKWSDLLKAEYKNKVALNGSPLTSGSAVAGVFAASIGNGGSLNDIGPGIDFFKKLKDAGNFIPVQATPQTIASGQTPVVIDWDYLNLAYVKEFPAARIAVSIPSDGVYGAHYCQAINASAPHPWAARLWQEFLYSDTGQLLWLKGFSHPARFQDMSKRKVIPANLLKALPAASIYAQVKFASPGQLSRARAKIAAEWPAKLGS
ncbi:MAG: putative spermidine/putrescine transport system substrate-binding protein [Gaiellaceae bacterium]|nr:putative spermidine/putrescine transport system substrate-binding protein [Gaiellaceae bacterium]